MARLAELQQGHVHVRQLRAAGIGKSGLARRLRGGGLHAVLPGVYLVGRPHRDLRGRSMAGALYMKGDALVADRAAAHIWEMLDTTQVPGADAPVDVLVVGRGARSIPGVRVHRTRSVARMDIRWRNGIPVTSPARTILDLAGTMGELGLEAALSAAFRKNLVRRAQLAEVMDRNPRAKGISRLRALLEHVHALRDTRSEYERKFLSLLRAAELPLPLTNVRVADRLVDGVWPDLKLIYEFDGWSVHRDKFESDRLRDQHLLIAGHSVMRISSRQIDFTPHALVARTAAVITTLRLAAGQPGEG